MDSRFLKPVYPGSTCHPGLDPGQVKFTCREKLDQCKPPLKQVQVKAEPPKLDQDEKEQIFGSADHRDAARA